METILLYVCEKERERERRKKRGEKEKEIEMATHDNRVTKICVHLTLVQLCD